MKLFAPQHRVDAGHELGIGYETPAGQRRVVVETAVGSGSVDILVRDSGPGLPVELTGRLFEPFVTTKTSGLGLGLSIVRSIVTAHGGRIDVRKAPGGGAVFCVTLPHATGRLDVGAGRAGAAGGAGTGFG